MILSRFLLASALTVLVMASEATATDTGTVRFDVCYADPDAYFLNLIPGACDGDPVLATEIETYMSEVVQELAAQGFRMPTFSDPVGMAAGLAYRVYVYDADDARRQAAYNNPCGGATPYIYLDLARSGEGALFDGGKITHKGFIDIAHELFHATQASYGPFTETCKLGDWIIEGTAQAWGKDTALKLRGVPRDAKNRPTVKWDARGYDSALYVRSGADAYSTGSFWRFLGEEYAARTSGGRATMKPRPADYSYLHRLFEHPFSETPDETREYEWIDQGLRQAFGRGLGSLYPSFTSHFAGFVPGREPQHKSRRNAWLSHLFDTCPRLELSLQTPQIRTEYRMEPLSTRCVVIAASPLGPVDLSVQFYSDGDVALEDIVVGVGGDGRTARGAVVDLPGGLALSAATIPLNLSDDRVILIGNAASNAAETRAISLPVAFSISTHHANLQTPSDSAKPNTTPSRSDATDTASDPLKAAAMDRTRSGAVALSPSLLGGNSVSRSPDAPPCAQPFMFTACGPATTLSFSLRPSGIRDLDSVQGSGGMVSQITTNLSGLGALYADDPQYDENLRELLEKTDGSEISLRIPLIDYGFTGSFSNARIIVTMAGDTALEAVGPADVQPGPARRFPLSGSVTIDEYTPLLMRGRFAAQLVRMGERGTADDPTLPVERILEGRFVISQPWRNDRRVKRRTAAVSAMETIEEAFPGISVLPGAGLAVNPPPLGVGGSQASGASTSAGCNCSCNHADSVSPSCRSQCAPVFAACAPERPDAAPQTQAASETGSEDVDAMRGELIEVLRGVGAGEASIAGQLQIFDALPDNAKSLFLDSIRPK